MSYDAMRHFADSWGLVFMGLTYLILISWHFRPGARRRSGDAATMIFTDSEPKGGDHG